MLVSKAPDAELYLLAALSSAGGALTGVAINGFPVTDANWSDENLFIDSVDFEQSARGFDSRNDDFTINLVILVRKVASAPAVKARAWEIAGAVQSVVNGDPLFGGLLNQHAEVSGGSVETYPASPDGDWETRAEVRVHAQAVLTE